MDECDENCKHLKLYEDGLDGNETIETGGYCMKFNKMVYFGEECPDYAARDIEEQLVS